jgi:serine/threonine-protein kinase
MLFLLSETALAVLLSVIILPLSALALILFWRRSNTVHASVEKPPFECDFSKYEVAVPLKSAFRFAHEPLRSDSNGRFVGRAAELEALALRIMFSEGGSFLVTGYRGVGKTTFVNRVVRQLEEMVPWAQSIFGETKIIDVQLNLARPLTAAELMHHIIRRLYERLEDKGVYARLSSSLKHDLKLAYQRTSFNMTRSLGEETEKNFGFSEANIGVGFLKAALKGAMSIKRTRSEGSEYEYLGYDDKAAESDVVRLSRQLSGAFVPEQTFRDRINGLFSNKQPPKRTRLIIVFIFDELDKLEEFTVTNNGRTTSAIDELLSALKNVFTTSGVSFVFVAGKDTQERWLEDLGKGDSVYESVFAYDKYLPCMWSDVDSLCDEFVDWEGLLPAVRMIICEECGANTALPATSCAICGHPLRPPPPSSTDKGSVPCDKCAESNKEAMFCDACGLYLRDSEKARAVFKDFKKYLDYRGRGIPRRVIRGFNEYVLWTGKRPILVFTKNDVRRIRVYSELQKLLAKNEQRLFGNLHEEVWGTLQDKRRLGVYYLTDWILRQGNGEFTVKDAVAASKGLSTKIAPAEEIALNVITDIVSVMTEGEFLMEVEERLDKVQIGDISAKQEKRHKLVPRRLIEMRGDADVFEAESYVVRNVSVETDRVAHYQLLEKIGHGGMGAVYRAWDEQTGQIVAVKVLTREFGLDPQAVERFKREAMIMSRLRHQNIVKCYGTGDDTGRLYIAMEYVDGIDLERILKTMGRLELAPSLTVARALAEALRYVHDQGLVRNDIKPGNIMLNKNGNIYLMDFGIAKQASIEGEGQAITFAGTIVGTPFYMSPEQFQGLPVDARSDIYSFGIVFYEMLTGQLPFKGDSLPQTMVANLYQSPPSPSKLVTELPVDIDQIVLRCLEKDPSNRFQNANELLAELNKAAKDLPPIDVGTLVADALENRRKEAIHFRTDTDEFIAPAIDRDIKIKPPISYTGTRKDVEPLNSETIEPPPKPTYVAEKPEPASKAPPTPVMSDQTAEMGSEEVNTTEKGVPVSARLVLTSPHSTIVRTFYLPTNKRTQLGRGPDNDIVLEEPYASRFHADLEFRDGDYYLRDLNTSNGTFVNGTRINEPLKLKDHDKIQIGESTLELRLN